MVVVVVVVVDNDVNLASTKYPIIKKWVVGQKRIYDSDPTEKVLSCEGGDRGLCYDDI